MTVAVFDNLASGSGLARTINKATWALAHDGAGDSALQVGLADASGGLSGVLFHVYRGFLAFDTSSIPIAEDITRVILRLYIISHDEVDPGYCDLHVVEGVQSLPLVATDFGAHVGKVISGGLLSYALMVDDVLNRVVLNATGRSWVNKGPGAVTKFCLRVKGDIDNISPSGNNYISVGCLAPDSLCKLVVSYGAIESAIVTTDPALLVLAKTGVLNGTLDYDGGEDCDCGFEWGLTPALGNITPTQTHIFEETFSQTLTGLKPNTTYYFRAFATNSVGTAYGNILSFSTTSWYFVESIFNELNFYSDLNTIIRGPSGRVYCVYGAWLDYSDPEASNSYRSLRIAYSDDLYNWNYVWVPFTQDWHWYSAHALAIDSSGNVYLVAREYKIGALDVLVLSIFDKDLNLITQEVFETDVNGNPDISAIIDGSNNIHVAWHNFTGWTGGDTNTLYYRRRTPSGWDAREEIISTTGPWAYLDPALCVNTRGIPHIICVHEKKQPIGYWDYRYVHWQKETGFWDWEAVYVHPVEERTTSYFCNIVASPDGRFHYSYRGDVGGVPVNYYCSGDEFEDIWPIEIIDPADESIWQGLVCVYINDESKVFVVGWNYDIRMGWMRLTGEFGSEYWVLPSISIDGPSLPSKEVDGLAVLNHLYPIGSRPGLPSGDSPTDHFWVINQLVDSPYEIWLWGAETVKIRGGTLLPGVLELLS